MVQLTSDCFQIYPNQHFQDENDLLSLEGLWHFINENVPIVAPIIEISVDEALHYCVASDIYADIAVPNHHNSAVDGYAVYYDDLNFNKPTSLKIAGMAKAGHCFKDTVKHGEALRVFTGAMIDDALDTIYMEEDCQITEDGYVIVPPPQLKGRKKTLKKGANLRLKGDDVEKGDLLFKKQCKLYPHHIALLVAQRIKKVKVFKKLKIGVLSTGDELLDYQNDGEHDMTAPINTGKIYDSNRLMIINLLKNAGFEWEDMGILPDDYDKIHDKLTQTTCDCIISSGGMGKGDEDHISKILSNYGHLSFWRIAIKPGRPVGMATIRTISDKFVPIIGLPGNSIAAFTTYIFVAKYILNKLGGASTELTPLPSYIRPFMVPFQPSNKEGEKGKYNKKVGRVEFVRAKLKYGNDMQMQVEKYGKSGAGILSSMTEGDGFIMLPSAVENIKQGDKVQFLSLYDLLYG